MDIPKDIKYTIDHEWVKIEDDHAVVGISDFAQHELGDIVFIEFPVIGDAFKKGDTIGTIEAVKTVTDLYAPLSGEITEVNTELDNLPESVNSDPYGHGWIVKMKITINSEISLLLSSEKYKEKIQ